MDSSVSIKILTRDRPDVLRSALSSVRNDILKDNINPSITLVDDSKSKRNRETNIKLIREIFINDSFNVNYFGREEHVKALTIAPTQIKNTLLSLAGTLGSGNYQPSRTKNISQLICSYPDYELLLDDDIIIDPDNKSKHSIINLSVRESKSTNSYVSIDMKGFIDVSSIQLLERSILKNDENKTHLWNEDSSSYNLSGGFLLCPRHEIVPMFPNSYNEDFLWVAYSVTKNNMKTRKLSLDVFHVPDKPRTFCQDRLIYEGLGEILYETFRKTNIKGFVEEQSLPSQFEVETAKRDYCDYINHVLSLLSEFKDNKPLDSNYLGQLDLEECKKILIEHLFHVRSISYITIQEFFKKWMNQNEEWAKARLDFQQYIKQNLILIGS